VHLERLADPLAHELLLEHDGLGGMHHGRRREDGVVALDTVQDVPDLDPKIRVKRSGTPRPSTTTPRVWGRTLWK